MSIVIVLDNPKDWPLRIDGAEVVSAKSYLTEPRFSERRQAKVFNLCRSYRYQSMGYYVSLLAAARGHKPLPAISTIQDLKLSEMIRIADDHLEELIESSLAGLRSGTFVLSIYFGRNLARKYDKLALALFNQFPAPFLRAEFRCEPAKSDSARPDSAKWELTSLRPIAVADIPEDHHAFVLEMTKEYFDRPRRVSRPAEPRYDLAILCSEDDANQPSNERAIKRFIKAAESMGIDADVITKDDYGRLAEFDALFVRTTTAVNHYTFRFSRRAAAEGLVVMDDPESIIKCANKVYLAELLQRHRIPGPRTVIIHRGNAAAAIDILGLPCVLKQPDSSFSLGVVKATDRAEFEAQTERLFELSDLLIAQEWLPTAFDWRVGVIDREPVFVCKYHMAKDHWQIIDRGEKGETTYGRFENYPIEAAPPDVVKTAIRAANLIGDGIYGVDLKEVEGRPLVMEINDNPNIDAGVEDEVLQDELYLKIMRVFLKRLESRGR